MSPDPTQDLNSSLESLGSILRQTREARGLTITEVSHDTYIRSQYIEALENSDLSRLPEMVYVQGFLKRYADYLGLNGETLTKKLPSLPERTVVEAPKSKQMKVAVALRPLHLWTAYVALIVVAVGGLSALLNEGNVNPFARWWTASQGNSPDPNAPKIPGSNQSTKQVFPTLKQWTYIAGVFPKTDTSIAQITPGKPVQLDIRVEQLSWLRVIADGRNVFEATLQPGEKKNWSADQSIVLLTGNAGGVLVTFNNQELGHMGNQGEVKEKVFQRPSSEPAPPQIQ